MNRKCHILFAALVVLWSCWVHGDGLFAKKVLEFEVICPKGTRIGSGICLAEHEGQEIIVCCFRDARKKYHFQAYDMAGKQLAIHEDVIASKAAGMLNAHRVCQDSFVNTSEDAGVFAMFLQFDKSGKKYAENDPARIVWKHHFSEYTDFDVKWANRPRIDSGITKYACVHSPMFYNRTLPSLYNLSSAVAPLVAFDSEGNTQIWGVSCENGKEVFTVRSTRLGMIDKLYFSSDLQRVALRLASEVTVGEASYSFFKSREDLSINAPVMEFNAHSHQMPNLYKDDAFFVTDDVFCFGGRHKSSLSQEYYAFLYSFSKNKVFAKIQLGNLMAMHCEPWAFPWCAISKDGEKLVFGYVRSSRLSYSQFRNFIRIYELKH